MRLAEEQNRKVLPMGWSAEEELVISTIQQRESVPRPEAIRRMQRRKKASRMATLLTSSKRVAAPAAGRMCRNPRCTRGDDGGPASLGHLRADALYCDATCKKAGQRSPNRQNRPSNRQCSRGPKGDKSGSLLSLPYQHKRGAQIASNRKQEFLGEPKQLARSAQEMQPTERKQVDCDLVLE
jgi:hypothetical protein